MSGPDVAAWLPEEMAHLLRALKAMTGSGMGPFAVVGGVAVAVRLGQAHRTTQDIDAVVDASHAPAAREVLSVMADAASAGPALLIANAEVELLEVGQVPEASELGQLSRRQALFALSHSWALQTAGPARVATRELQVEAPFATAAALVAMKLHAIQDRSGAQQDKRAGDAWDLHQLLTVHNARGQIAADLLRGPAVLREAVAFAVDTVLLAGADRTRSWLRGLGGAAASVSAEELRVLGEGLVEQL